MSHDPLANKATSLVGAVQRTDERTRQALHRQRGFRQAPVAGRYRRQPGARRDAGRAGHHQRAGPGRHPARHGADRQRDRGRPLRVEAGTGRRAPEHRGAPDPLVGDAGKRLHTGRSRNDQVATDVRLWLRGEIDRLAAAGRDAARAGGPGQRTHADRDARLHPHAGGAAGELCAPPAGLRGDVLARRQRLADVRKRVNRLPLGAAALAGTSYPLDRERVARTLGFDGMCGTAWTP
jgi:hypothetical protein